MKQSKWLMVFLLALALTLVSVGCDDGGEDDKDTVTDVSTDNSGGDTTPEDVEEDNNTPEDTTEDTPPEDVPEDEEDIPDVPEDVPEEDIPDVPDVEEDVPEDNGPEDVEEDFPVLQESCDEASLTSCFSNAECGETERCQNLGGGDLYVSCCVVGERGVLEIGEPCAGELDCASGVCTDYNGSELFCSADCYEDASICPDNMECHPFAGLCMPIE